MSASPASGPLESQRVVARDASAVRDVASFARRAASTDAAAVLRVVARGQRLAIFAQTPFEVLAMRAVELAEALEGDVVVEAGTLAARAAGAVQGAFTLPPPVPALSWTGSLPPFGGWDRLATLSAAQVAARVEDGVAEFRRRVEAMTEADRSRAALESVAADVWDRELVPEAPTRLAHASASYGFLGESPYPGQVHVLQAGTWTRLDATFGSTLARRSSPLDLFV